MFGFASRAISAVLTIFFLISAIPACSVVEERPVELPAQPITLGHSVTVRVLQSRPEISHALQQALDLYSKTQGDVQFSVETIAQPSDYRAALRSRLLSGETVDLFHLDGVVDAAELYPFLEDLAPLPWVNLAEPSLLEPVTAESSIVGVPYSMEGIGLIANRNIFEAAGVNVDDIVDFESLSDALTTVQDMIDAGELEERFPDLVAVTDLAGQDKEYLAGPVAEVAMSGAFTSSVQAYYSSSLLFPSSGESLISLLAQHSPHKNGWKGIPLTTQNQMVENGLASGRVAMILHNAEVYRRVYAQNPALEGRLALVPIPLEDAEYGAVYTAAPAYWAVNKDADPEAKQHAINFLTWLYRSEEGAAFYAREFAALSPYQDTAVTTDLVLHRQLLSLVDRGRTLPQVHGAFPLGWGEDTLAVELQQYFSDYDKKWKDVSTAAESDWAHRKQPLSP